MTRYWPFARRLILALLLCCVVAQFLVVGLEEVRANTNSSAYDQRSYLNLATQIRAGKKLTDGKRHPLYPILLVPLASREWAYFTQAKLVSLALGLIGLWLTFEVGRRLYGAWAGLLATLLLSLNGGYLHSSSHAICESLLIPLCVLCWYGMVRAFERPRAWALAGAAGGLAYLTKPTSPLLVLAFALTVAVIYGPGLLRRPAVWLFPTLYLLVALPLLVYNYGTFGSPFYNYSSSHTVWLETWDSRDVADSDQLPTFWSYLRARSPRAIVAREWQGLQGAGALFGRTLLPTTRQSWPEGLAGMAGLLGLLVVAGGSLALCRRQVRSQLQAHRAEWLLTASLVSVTLLSLGWYAQVQLAARWYLPVLPMIYVTASAWLVGCVRAGLGWLSSVIHRPMEGVRHTSAFLGAVLLVGWCSVAARPAWAHVGEDPFLSDVRANAAGDSVLTWLQEGARAQRERIIWGPGYTLPNWRYEGPLDFKELPAYAQNWSELGAFVQEREARYAILDWEVFDRRTPALQDHFGVDHQRITLKAPPPGWALALASGGLPCQWCVFRLPIASPPDGSLSVRLGDGVALTAYELYPASAPPGGTVHVILYWQAGAPQTADYSVFVHLVDGTGRLVSQGDGPPLAGTLPTSEWPAGYLLADRHDIPLPADLAAGEYQVWVGLYRLETMERLPATDADGRRLSEDQIPLPLRIAIGDGAS